MLARRVVLVSPSLTCSRPGSSEVPRFDIKVMVLSLKGLLHVNEAFLCSSPARCDNGFEDHPRRHSGAPQHAPDTAQGPAADDEKRR